MESLAPYSALSPPTPHDFAGTADDSALRSYFTAWDERPKLRFLTCGSVDDGKSTLIGRLLHDSQSLLSDQVAALAADSRTVGTQGENLDFALLVDGLAAEREQGITIDVAYRFFATDRRKFVVADTPGHEQFTRNMVTGASTADLAIILVDARLGILTQTRRHAMIARLLGIRDIVLAVNKMDLVDYDQDRFADIVRDFRSFSDRAGIADFTAIPLSGLTGANVTAKSADMPWYDGPVLLDHLESVAIGDNNSAAPFRMAVQWVNRRASDFRGFAGRISSGTIRSGDSVTVLPSGTQTTVDRIVTFDGDFDRASAGRSVTLTFTDEVDCSRGDVIVRSDVAPECADHITANLVWMDSEGMTPNRSYWLKIGSQTVSAHMHGPDHILDIDTLDRRRGTTLAMNDIGMARLSLDRKIAPVTYAESRRLGGFVLIDKMTNATVAAGMVTAFEMSGPVHGNREATHIIWSTAPAGQERHNLARSVEDRLRSLGYPVIRLDRDALKSGIARDVDGDALLDRTIEAARLIARAGAYAVIALDVDPPSDLPGQRVASPEWNQEGPGQWTI